MIKGILRFLGLTDAPREEIPPQLCEPIDAETFKSMRGGAVAIADRKTGKIHISIRHSENGCSGIVMEDGRFYADVRMGWPMYGQPGGWQAYRIAPFEVFCHDE